MFVCFLSVWETQDKYSLWSYFDKAFSFTTLAGRQNQKPDENMFYKWYRKATRRKTAFHHREKDSLSPSPVPQLSEPSSGPCSSVSLICSLRLQSLGASYVGLLTGPGSCQTHPYPLFPSWKPRALQDTSLQITQGPAPMSLLQKETSRSTSNSLSPLILTLFTWSYIAVVFICLYFYIF